MSEPALAKKVPAPIDPKKIFRLENGPPGNGGSAVHLGLALLFLIAVGAFVSLQAGTLEHSAFVIAAGVIGGYMAINIGANDVANNVGPAVGSRALTMAGALVIAAVCETAGAVLAGGDVVNTISKGIIDPALMPDTATFIMAMTGALLAAALWLNLATYFGAPVSTTHAIVGGVLGAGIAATGDRRRELGHHGQDRRQLGDLALARRRRRGAFPGLHQVRHPRKRTTRSPPPNAGCPSWWRSWPRRSPCTWRRRG